MNLTAAQAAKYLGYKVKTLQKWDREGKLVAGRTVTGRRVYTEEQLEEFLGRKTKKESSLPVEKQEVLLEMSNLVQGFSSLLQDLREHSRKVQEVILSSGSKAKV
jgi:excisionase family DNA binding protein